MAMITHLIALISEIDLNNLYLSFIKLLRF